jgi:serine/threonine protein phosphatase PrpC
MKLRLHPHSRFLLAGLLAFCLALGALAGFALPAGAAAQTPRTAAPFTIPSNEGVAIAQIATVRIVATYTFTFTLGNLPGQTRQGQCTGLGVLLQSSQAASSAGSVYLLTTTSVLSAKNQQCPEASLGVPTNPAPKNVTVAFSGADVYLSTAYSGLGQTPIKLQIKDATALLSNLTTSPSLTIAVATAANNGAFSHDYPTIALATQGTTGQVIDLKTSSGLTLSSSDLNGAAGSSIDPSQYLTPVPSATIPPNTSVGAPVVDTTTGALVGLVDRTGALDSAIGKLSTDTLPGASTACPGLASMPTATCLSAQWRAAMDAYYGNNKHDVTKLETITSDPVYAKDFVGAKDFLSAAQQTQVTASPTPASTSPSKLSSPSNSGGLLGSLNLNSPVTIGLIVLVVLLVLVFIMTLLISVRRLRRRSDQAQQAQAMQGGAFPTRSRPSGQLEQGYGVPPGASAAASYPPMPNGPARRTVVCQRCGVQNNLGASTCMNCGADLPQGVAGTSGVGRGLGRSTSGGPMPLSLPPLNPPPAPTPDIAEMPTMTYSNQGASNPELERTLPTVPVVGPRQDEATVVIRGRQRQPLGIKVSTKSDVGRRRAGKANEDNYLAVTGTWKHNGQLQPFGLFVVADGMGGHANGQDASRMAVETIYQHLTENLPHQDIPDENLGEFLQQAIQRANQMIYHQNQKDHADMGCTMTAALITGNEAHICNVGDSRTYLLTPNDHLQRVTTDHSIVQSLVDAGVIQKDDVYTHPKRNQIYRSLGEKEAQEIDVFRQRLGPNDKLLLCCDGLWEMVRDPEIEQAMRQDDLPQVASKLIDMANENGGVDNITAIVVKVTEEAKPAKQPMIQSVASGTPSLSQTQR